MLLVYVLPVLVFVMTMIIMKIHMNTTNYE